MNSAIARLLRLGAVYFSPLPSYLILFVTSRCNARCKMCFNWKEQEGSRDELSLEEIDKISRNFKDLLQLTLGGGEPFLRDDIPRIIESFYKNSRARFFTITTNASFPEKIESNVSDVLRNCPDALLNVGLSIDGIGNFHDDIRALPGGFDRLMETYRRLKKIKELRKNLSIKITTVLSSFNADKIDEILKFVKESMDVDDHEVLLARGDTRLEDAKNIPPGRYKQVIKMFEENSKRNRSKRGHQFSWLFYELYKCMNTMVSQTLEKNEMILPCVAGRRLIEIYQDGTVRPCEILHTLPPRTDSSMGNIKDFSYDIRKVLKSEKAKSVLKHIRKSKCFCTFECALIANIVFNPCGHSKLLMNAISEVCSLKR